MVGAVNHNLQAMKQRVNTTLVTFESVTRALEATTSQLRKEQARAVSHCLHSTHQVSAHVLACHLLASQHTVFLLGLASQRCGKQTWCGCGSHCSGMCICGCSFSASVCETVSCLLHHLYPTHLWSWLVLDLSRQLCGSGCSRLCITGLV